MTQRYRKKAVEVEAVLHKGDVQATFDAMRKLGWMRLAGFTGLKDDGIEVTTISNAFKADAGDWIVHRLDGVFYHVDAGSFAIEYEPASAPEVQGVDAEDLERLERMADSIERGGPADGDLGVAGDEAATFLRRVARSLASYQPDSGVDQLQVVVDFLASWRYCPVSSAESPSQACLALQPFEEPEEKP